MKRQLGLRDAQIFETQLFMLGMEMTVNSLRGYAQSCLLLGVLFGAAGMHRALAIYEHYKEGTLTTPFLVASGVIFAGLVLLLWLTVRFANVWNTMLLEIRARQDNSKTESP